MGGDKIIPNNPINKTKSLLECLNKSYVKRVLKTGNKIAMKHQKQFFIRAGTDFRSVKELLYLSFLR